ncbi:MAG TPA: GNVR domain-containing protein [Gemmatimonadaceae bacterium]|nr:GNVR domain-containing protein [Gemmatimonadaceae bacterium]
MVTPPHNLDAAPPLTFSVWIGGIIRRWALVLKVMALVLLLGGLAALIMPPVYVARSSFFANSSSSSSSLGGGGGGSLGGMRGLASQFGVGSLGDPSESPEFYSQLIESDELKRRLAVSRFPDERTATTSDSARLIDILDISAETPARELELGVKMLGGIVRTKFFETTNLVEVTVQARWPALASAVANRTVALVGEFNREQRASRARGKRQFLEQRVATAYEDLRRAEEGQRSFYEQNRQWRNSPGLVFEESRIKRNVDSAADLYMALRREFENARLDEFNDAALITVVDTSTVPQKPAWPKYGLLFATLVIVGGMIGLVVAGSSTILADWRARNPVGASFLRDSLDSAPLPRRRRKNRLSEGAAPIR